jgi:hypothetical protein
MMIHDDPGLALAHSVTHQTGEKRITTAIQDVVSESQTDRQRYSSNRKIPFSCSKAKVSKHTKHVQSMWGLSFSSLNLTILMASALQTPYPPFPNSNMKPVTEHVTGIYRLSFFFETHLGSTGFVRRFTPSNGKGRQRLPGVGSLIGVHGMEAYGRTAIRQWSPREIEPPFLHVFVDEILPTRRRKKTAAPPRMIHSFGGRSSKSPRP